MTSLPVHPCWHTSSAPPHLCHILCIASRLTPSDNFFVSHPLTCLTSSITSSLCHLLRYLLCHFLCYVLCHLYRLFSLTSGASMFHHTISPDPPWLHIDLAPLSDPPFHYAHSSVLAASVRHWLDPAFHYAAYAHKAGWRNKGIRNGDLVARGRLKSFIPAIDIDTIKGRMKVDPEKYAKHCSKLPSLESIQGSLHNF